MRKINIAIIGATGMVGEKFLEILEEQNFPINNLYLYASSRSSGKIIIYRGKEHTIIELKRENIPDKEIDIALFSAGASISKEFSPIFVQAGAIVIDNSSYWRMDENVPLIVPEVNGKSALNRKIGIIANPNCSTTQAMVPLKALHDKFVIKRVVFSTYQSVSGAGLAGFNDLANNTQNKFPHPISYNIIPHIDVFLENGYTKEEWKMIAETNKILDASIKITATTVRVPVFYGHCESINVEFINPASLKEINQALAEMPGIVLLDEPSANAYPTPLFAEGKDDIFVGRVRIDETVPSGCNLWVVADNIRKGAATNAVQIAQFLLKNDPRFA